MGSGSDGELKKQLEAVRDENRGLEEEAEKRRQEVERLDKEKVRLEGDVERHVASNRLDMERNRKLRDQLEEKKLQLLDTVSELKTMKGRVASLGLQLEDLDTDLQGSREELKMQREECDSHLDLLESVQHLTCLLQQKLVMSTSGQNKLLSVDKLIVKKEESLTQPQPIHSSREPLVGDTIESKPNLIQPQVLTKKRVSDDNLTSSLDCKTKKLEADTERIPTYKEWPSSTSAARESKVATSAKPRVLHTFIDRPRDRVPGEGSKPKRENKPNSSRK
jgi:hypothetical protein